MEISLRDIRRVRLNSFIYIFRHWKSCFSVFEKIAISFLILLIIGTSFKWAQAASQIGTLQPTYGGVFVEGVTGSLLDDVDLGRLTKSGLVRIEQDGSVKPDLASSWTVSGDKLNYKFTLIDKISSAEIVSTFEKNPTYLPDATCEMSDVHLVSCKLALSDANFLNDLSKPLFPYGPYKLDKKTKNEIRLKRDNEYHLDRPFIDKFIIRMYLDGKSLEKAAAKGAIDGAINLDNSPQNWQQKQISLSKKHILFINSLKPYLKSLNDRTQLLDGKKPEGIKTLDVLEVNGVSTDPEYEALKQKLISAGIELKIRKTSLKDALLNDLPKRNYDILYLLVSENLSSDPYKYWNSSERTGDGENFAELADANIDKLTEQYRVTDDVAKKQEILTKINELVNKQKVSVEYKNITANYYVSPKIKGVVVNAGCLCETDRFNQVGKWYIKEKRVKN